MSATKNYPFLDQSLNQRIENNSLRTLQNYNSIDFCSNDYLGFSRSTELKELISEELSSIGGFYTGSSGSRLISGNTAYAEELEQFIAHFHDDESGLLFNSGYDANLGLFSCIAKRGDTIITDELIHACIIDGARLSHANRYIFKHNDIVSLEQKLKVATGNVFVGIESIYSMDGDMAPIQAISELCKKYKAHLIVDEAHATGVIGTKGQGLVNENNLQNEVFARIHTFGKALGCHGAIVLGSEQLRNYLINFARPFIYSTALPMHALVSIKCAYNLLEKSGHLETELAKKIHLFKNTIRNKNLINSNSPIQSILIPGNTACRAIAKKIQEAGYDVKAILSPTVPAGKERIRVCIHLHNTEEEIKGLASIINTL